MDKKFLHNEKIVLSHYLHDTKVINKRVVFCFVLTCLLLCILLARVYYLQFIEHEKFSSLAKENRIELVPLKPVRGEILDINGKILAKNVPVFSLVVVPKQVKDYEQLFKNLSVYLEFDNEDIESFHKRRRRHSKYDEVVFLSRLTDVDIAKFSVRQYLFPGVQIRGDLRRQYTHGYETAHVIGYVGRISDKDYKRGLDEKYKKLNYIGKSGIERSYESDLVGDLGYQQVESNAYGKTVRTVQQGFSESGKDLHLSLDIELQKIAFDALGDEIGSVVAMDPRNGNILTFVSKPSYDANLFVNGISQKNYVELRDDPNKPLLNRSMNGSYAPGSTIKGIVGLAALSQGINGSQTIYCPGHFSLPNSKHRYRCWKHSGHGRVDLKDSIKYSCDVYFYQTALTLGIDYIKEYMSSFGLGVKTGIDMIGESSGIVPNKQWKKEKLNKPWYKGETVIAGIGQGYMTATPLQLAVATSVVANKGKYVRPRLVQGYGHPRSSSYISIPPSVVETNIAELNEKVDSDAIFDEVIAAMSSVVNEPRGTASGIKSTKYTIAGKTGTAQVIGIAQGAKYNASKLAKKYHDHALFIGFAPIENPEIVVATIVENGGSGSKVAAPVVKKVLDAYFSNKYYKPELDGIYAYYD